MNTTPADFFEFEYCALPHKHYEEAKFFEECKKLKQRFTPEIENTLFPSAESKNVPIDGLPKFIEQTWDTIKDQKELNLPDQRIMVANLRCNELKEEALDKVSGSIAGLRDSCMRKYNPKFKEACQEIMETA